ncbi:MAG: TonB-dependent receptor plug domain-containing protein [Saprospiraceae bacterium]|nr:TonB-dependent receptor plug domain-containing protein [Saprospiraceae bacterium]
MRFEFDVNLSPLIFVLLCLFACSTTKGTKSTVARDVSRAPVDLTDQLRSLGGIQVTGDGATAEISIRGHETLTGSNEPLFLLNGSPIVGGYASVYSTVDPESIERIDVIRGGPKAALFGSRGANGIIDIILKD